MDRQSSTPWAIWRWVRRRLRRWLRAAMEQDREGVDGLDAWPAPFLAVMGRKTRRTCAPLSVSGACSARGIARVFSRWRHPSGCLATTGCSTSSPARPGTIALWGELTREADRLVGGPDAYLAIDDTALPKKGTLSVGVATSVLRDAGQTGQRSVSGLPHPAQGEMPATESLRLFLPEVGRTARGGACGPTCPSPPPRRGAIRTSRSANSNAEGGRAGMAPFLWRVRGLG
jgi:hypothetical protein